MADFSKPYDPKEVEQDLYRQWVESGFFDPDGLPGERSEPFTIMMPPPNVTGTLHVGHALGMTVQDIIIRFQRMRGKKTLWLPGTDHAAIATQAKVESLLYKEEKKTRHDFTREEFLARVEAFAKASQDTILEQVRRLGASADWSRLRYTFDEDRNRAVNVAFKRMYDDGLIFRGARIVNWDPKLQTTVSDEEVEWKDEVAPFYYLQYGPFVIGTARPETKFGDKYVVMHPDDARYQEWKHGQTIELEWINGPVTATIIKDPVIDMEFGTGVMTITPWHDAIDFDIAERHHLKSEQIIDFAGKLLPIAGDLAGLHINKARPLLVEKLKAKGLLVKVDEKYQHRIATNSRGGGVIEPQIKEQWFVDVNKEFVLAKSEIAGIEAGKPTTLKALMSTAVLSGQIRITPDRFEKIYFHWINNLRNWCISRQILYGHRIPVWYCTRCSNPSVAPAVKARWYFVRHGESVWNKEGRTQGQSAEHNPLTNEGILQAERVGRSLKDKNIQLIISSDIQRCKETAEIIARSTESEVVYDEGLRERHMGEVEGMLRTERDEKYGKELFWTYDRGPNGGETWQELEERAWNAYRKRNADHEGMNVVVVTHGGIIFSLKKKMFGWGEESVLSENIPDNSGIFTVDVLDPCASCGNDTFEQDSDTLDTWFSSGLWTFSTLGWPDETPDLKTYHPTDVLETGHDILFFWVARMILMSGYHVGQIPFRTVYLHGLVRDENKQKMSKSKGNIVDPLVMIDKFGTDALRMALVVGNTPGTDLALSEDKIKGYKHFANKLWNIARFVTMNLDEGQRVDMVQPAGLSENDKKILEELNTLITETTRQLDEFKFYLAAENLYHYVWRTFADKIIEEQKPRLQNPQERLAAQFILATLLVHSLKLLHPFMPFVTEAIWQQLPKENNSLLLIEAWPS